LEASQIHGFCGLLGVIVPAIFDTTYGLIYTGNLRQLGIQLLGILAIIVWSGGISLIYFYVLKVNNKFRVGLIYEVTGMDILMHGGTDNNMTLASLAKIEQ